MNKRAFSEGFSWFFAIISVLLILLIFYAVAKTTLFSSTSPSISFEKESFNELNNIRNLAFFEEYFHEGVYNNFSYNVYLFKENSLSNGGLLDLLPRFIDLVYTAPDQKDLCFSLKYDDKFIGRSRNFDYRHLTSLILEDSGKTPLSIYDSGVRKKLFDTGDAVLNFPSRALKFVFIGIKIGECKDG